MTHGLFHSSVAVDVRDGQVVKGVQFRDHEVVGEVVELAERYAAEGADELVFYDITASSDRRTVTSDWVEQVRSLSPGGRGVDLVVDSVGGATLQKSVACLGRRGRAITVGNAGRDWTPFDAGVLGRLNQSLTGVYLGGEITTPRVPCQTFAHHVERPRWVRRFTEAGRPGAYARVLRPGPVSAGDEVRVVEVPAHGVTIGRVFEGVTAEEAARLLAETDLADLAPSLVRKLDPATDNRPSDD